jgi:hypothetical protein
MVLQLYFFLHLLFGLGLGKRVDLFVPSKRTVLG